MKDKLNLDNLRELYLISNTARFLYNSFIREGSYIYLQEFSTSALITEFNSKIASEINDIDDLVYVYVLFIAIIQRSDESTIEFMQTVNLKYEWFPHLKEIYLSNLKPLTVNKIVTPNIAVKPNYNVQSNSDIDLIEI